MTELWPTPFVNREAQKHGINKSAAAVEIASGFKQTHQHSDDEERGCVIKRIGKLRVRHSSLQSCLVYPHSHHDFQWHLESPTQREL